MDPEATSIILQSGAPLTRVGFDATYCYSIFTDYGEVEKLGTPLADFFFESNRTRRIFCKEDQRLHGSNHLDTLTLALGLWGQESLTEAHASWMFTSFLAGTQQSPQSEMAATPAGEYGVAPCVSER